MWYVECVYCTTTYTGMIHSDFNEGNLLIDKTRDPVTVSVLNVHKCKYAVMWPAGPQRCVLWAENVRLDYCYIVYGMLYKH